ncbi:hypothetical protein [Methylobacterium sp. 37f]|uniref:hypothetical protein n=1 Tax=Methylobacterium sp. 37f TaxID=2817058 RepID=UPI001FFC8E77|nr:hypothetical protein [Methylobacterium sp. 37f]MCK2057225.1 hypothetical protein [Methylobacterium sp. 37f]
MTVSRETLAAVGELLAGGPDWRRPLAALLGPLHPEGARDTIDPRLPARWGKGDRGIPDWVGPALVILLDRHLHTLAAQADAIAVDTERAHALASLLRGK